MILKCQNKKCEYEWDYNGKAKFYACCPRCKGSVKIVRKEVKE